MVTRIDQNQFVVMMRFGCLACMLAFVLPAHAQIPDTLLAGTRVEVEGKGAGTGSIRAEEVEIQSQRGGKDTLKGSVRTVDPASQTLTVAGVKIVASDATLLEGPDREPVPFSEFQPGQRLKAEGVFGQDGHFTAERLSVRKEKAEKADEVAFEGPVQQVDPGSKTFTVFGVTVMVTPQTAFQRERN
jgi:hypothetical protein